MEINLSFVTVTFRDDFDLLARQLTTMDHHLDDSYTHYIVLNDLDTYLPELEQIVNCHTRHRYKIFLYSQLKARYPTIIEDSQSRLGWHIQQVLKLAIANEVETEFYCLLDSKDFFHWHCNPMQELFANNKPLAFLEVETVFEEFYTYRRRSYEIFGLSDTNDRCMRTHTPFVMKTSYVLDMLEYMSIHNLSVTQLIEGDSSQTPYNGRCVEFYLYMAWLRLNGLLDEYVWGKDFDKTFFSVDLRRPDSST